MKNSFLRALLVLALCFFSFGASKTVKNEYDEEDDHKPQEIESLEVIPSGDDFRFQAEVTRLMDIIINSLYTNRDIFIRELISNSADALEKVRILSLKRPEVLNDPSGQKFNNLEIYISIDTEKGEISIEDTGIGMTRDDLIQNLGTIAHSGTLANNLVAKNSNMIGQFGVGFYSSFLVADEVTVTSKHPDEEHQYVWRCNRKKGGFSIVEDPRKKIMKRGTRVTLKLRDDSRAYLHLYQINDIIKRYSQFLQFPIYVQKDAKHMTEWKQINFAEQPIWLRDKNTVKPEEYNKFYKNMTNDDLSEPLAYTHFAAEAGDISFKSILYVPAHNKELAQMVVSGAEHRISNVKIYVRRVLISDNLEAFLPRWLSFLKGVVDSDDLPLKVDREQFSETRVMKTVKSTIIRKFLELLKNLAGGFDSEKVGYEAFQDKAAKLPREEQEAEAAAAREKFPAYHKYHTIWERYGQNLVLGCAEDASKEDRKKIGGLMRFPSSKSRGYPTSFDDYISRMKPGQDKIYFATGLSYEALMESPYLEKYIEKDVEVLFLIKSWEESCFQSLERYKDVVLQTIEKNRLKPGELDFEDKKAKKTAEQRHAALKIMYQPLVDWVQDYIGAVKAQFVMVSSSLVKSPTMISSPEHGMTANNERLMRSSALANTIQVEAFSLMKNFELNGDHPYIYELLQKVSSKKKEASLKEAIDVLYEASLISSGFPPRRPHLVTGRLYQQLTDNKKWAEKFEVTIPKDVWKKAEESLSSEKQMKDSMPKFTNLDDLDYDDDDAAENFNSENAGEDIESMKRKWIKSMKDSKQDDNDYDVDTEDQDNDDDHDEL